MDNIYDTFTYCLNITALSISITDVENVLNLILVILSTSNLALTTILRIIRKIKQNKKDGDGTHDCK